ncbi:MAG: cation:proton antiporter [Bacteroidetes bacterium]|nr:MAG: cation:proton antiporter [Bacteroidota bacterium]
MDNIVFYISIAMLMVTLLAGLIRFIKGPSVVDRVVAFDSMTVTSLVMIGVIAFLSNRAIYLDVAVVYGFLSFLGVIIVAKYIQGGL